mmetsp:Transcript_28259/g.79782  ORF Transcript_28259/g.79782 Transcript_28259/m.79782 type:complete len:346 (-) Transcript_28259:462-1499(-)
METDNEAAGQQYNPPEINFTSATSYDGQDSHIDPFSSQGPASASGPNWTEQGLQEVSPEESSGNVALEFTDSHVTPYTVVEGKIGSSSILTGVHPEDQGGSLMPQGTVYSSDGPHFSGGRSSSVPHGDQPAPHGKAWFWNPRRYQTYFNVDTSDVLKRMADSLKGPFMPNFLDNTRTNPDLYGPFWVVTTVIFITAVTGNLNDYLSHSKNQRAAEGDDVDFWFYDIDKVSISAFLFYGYVGLVGLLLWGVLAYHKSTIGLAHVWCIYGYSLTIFLPIAPLCTLPISWLQWLLVLGSTIMSGLFLVLNLSPDVKEATGARAFLVLLGVLGLHLGLGLSLRLFFFRF